MRLYKNLFRIIGGQKGKQEESDDDDELSNQGSDIDQKSSDESIKDDNITESDDESKDKKIGGKKYGNSIVIINLYLINSFKKISLLVIITLRRKIVRFINGPRNLDIRLKGKSNSKVLANKCYRGHIYLIMISKIHNK